MAGYAVVRPSSEIDSAGPISQVVYAESDKGKYVPFIRHLEEILNVAVQVDRTVGAAGNDQVGLQSQWIRQVVTVISPDTENSSSARVGIEADLWADGHGPFVLCRYADGCHQHKCCEEYFFHA